MRRAIGVVLVTALAVALSLAVASATSLDAPSYDFRSAVFMQVFGEITDPASAVAAAYGDRTSESPLRALALRVPDSGTNGSFMVNVAAAPTFTQAPQRPDTDGYRDLAQTVGARLLSTSVLYSAPAAPRTDAAPSTVSSVASPQAFPVAAYQPVEAAAYGELPSGEVSFAPIAGSQALAKTSASGVAGAGGTSASLPALLHVGPVNFEGQVQGDSTQAPQIALHDNSYGAGADIAVRAGRRNLDVGLSSSYEQLTRNDANFSAAAPSASLALPGGDTSLVIPNYSNLSRLTLNAGVAVPLVNGLTLNLNYDTARLLGSYGLPGLTNLDSIDNAYGGGLTFALPHSSSTLSLSAYQFRYQDNILPANSVSQTRENLNFTVKF
ncbi:MAG TPA: hypothetical protein VFE36_00900 [Candidatus Baltobacteraceae bacterium]|jgi:hypothetical protein|nr:hypothetical protein [Candidatus Baltobacteraceae bacterium]